MSGVQVKLDLLQAPDAAKGTPIDHGLASGRIAFACDLVPPIHSEAAAANSGTVITPPLTLPTPGKADVVVTILGDPGERLTQEAFCRNLLYVGGVCHFSFGRRQNLFQQCFFFPVMCATTACW